jgi:hypothetical protein
MRTRPRAPRLCHGDLRYLAGCLSSSHSTFDWWHRPFVDALGQVWDTGDAAAPLDPRLPPMARQVLLDALRPTRIVGSDGEQHALHDGIGVEVGDALVVATSGTLGSTQRCRAHTPCRCRLGQGEHPPGSALIPTDTCGWPVCHWPISAGLAVVTRAIVTGTPLVVVPGFDAESRCGSGALGPGVPCVAGGDCAAAARSLGLQLRAPRRQQGSRRAATQRRRHLRHD